MPKGSALRRIGKAAVCSMVSLCLIALSPGLGCYQALAQSHMSAAPSKPFVGIVTVPAALAVGSQQLGGTPLLPTGISAGDLAPLSAAPAVAPSLESVLPIAHAAAPAPASAASVPAKGARMFKEAVLPKAVRTALGLAPKSESFPSTAAADVLKPSSSAREKVSRLQIAAVGRQSQAAARSEISPEAARLNADFEGTGKLDADAVPAAQGRWTEGGSGVGLRRASEGAADVLPSDAARIEGLPAAQATEPVQGTAPTGLRRVLKSAAQALRRIPGVEALRQFGKTIRLIATGDLEFKEIHDRYKGRFYLTAGLLVADAALSIGMSKLVGQVLDYAEIAVQSGLSAVMPGFGIVTGALLAAVAVYAAVEFGHARLNRLLGVYMARDYRKHFMAKFVAQDLYFHAEHKAGELTNRLREDTNHLSNKNVSLRVSLAHYVLVSVLATAVLFHAHWPLALLVMCVVPFLGIISGVYGERFHSLYLRIQDAKAELMSASQEVFSQATIVHAFDTHQLETQRYAKKAEELRALMEEETRLEATLAFLTSFGDFFTRYFIYILGGWALAAGLFGMSVGTIVSSAMYAGYVDYGFQGLSSIYMAFKRSHGATEVLRSLDKRVPAIQDPVEPKPAPTEGAVSFTDVRAHYEGNDTPVLDGLSVDVPAGRTLGVVGQSGSGKSTIASLLLGLYRPDAGRIEIDGNGVAEMTHAQMLEKIAIVPQHVRLFNNMTMRENMTYGSPNATEAELAQAIESAQATFVYDDKRFPEGLATVTAEGGDRLSGGERQRVAIVRALLRKPAILILDDATSALDNASERRVQTALEESGRAARGRAPTTIIIAQRLSTVTHADDIIVLDKGRVSERGTHVQLLAANGLYRRLWDASMNEEAAATAPAANAAGQSFVALLSASLAAAALLAGGALLAAAGGPALLMNLLAGGVLADSGALLAVVAGLSSQAMVQIGAGTALSVLSLPLAAVSAAFLSSGLRMAFAQRRAGSSWSSSFFDAMATPLFNSVAMGSLPRHIREFIDVHERAHAEKHAGEAGALLRQVAAVPAVLRGELLAAKEALASLAAKTAGMLKAFGVQVWDLLAGDAETREFLSHHKGKMTIAFLMLTGGAALSNVSAYLLQSILDTGKTAMALKGLPAASLHPLAALAGPSVGLAAAAVAAVAAGVWLLAGLRKGRTSANVLKAALAAALFAGGAALGWHAFLLGQVFLSAGAAAAAAAGLSASFHQLAVLSLQFVGVILASIANGWGFAMSSGLLRAHLASELRVALTGRLLRREMDFHLQEQNDSASLASRVNDDVDLLIDKNVAVRLPLLRAALMFGLSAVLMLRTSWWLSMLVFAVMPVLGIGNAVIGNKFETIYASFTKARAALSEKAKEIFTHIATVKSFAREDAEVADYGARAHALAQIGEQDSKLLASTHVLSSSITQFFTNYAVYLVGAWALALGLAAGLTIGQITGMTIYASFVKSAFDTLTGSWMSYKQSTGGTEVIRDWLRTPPAIQDAPGARALPPIRGEIEFENVDFGYKSDSAKILDGFSLRIRPGETVAFVGSSGSGKSTIVRLVERLWEPQAGRVLVDGHDVRGVTLASLRGQIATVQQETRLFNDTLRYNLLYGSEGVSEEELRQAIHDASADFVFDEKAFPNGLDTLVGADGSRISGGQQQRVAFVRAILRMRKGKGKILLLDEATASLDKKTEKEVQATLESMRQGMGAERPTTLVVAHNLTTIMGADRIVVLDHGRPAEIGTHQELLDKNGLYKSLWEASLAKEKNRT